MRRLVLRLGPACSLVGVALLGAACATGSNSQTLSQELAAERWEKCRHISGIQLREIRPDGAIFVWVEGAAQRGWEACLQRAAAEQTKDPRASDWTRPRSSSVPQDAKPLNNAGNAYASSGDYDRAIQAYDQAIRLDPQYALSYYNRGNAYRAKGDQDRAIQDYTDSIRLDPRNPSAFNNRGIAYRAKGDLDHAIQDFDEAIRLDPKHAFAFNNRGLVHADKRDWDRAIQDYDEAIRINPKFVNAYKNRGNAYQANGDAARAAQDREQAARYAAPTPK